MRPGLVVVGNSRSRRCPETNPLHCQVVPRGFFDCTSKTPVNQYKYKLETASSNSPPKKIGVQTATRWLASIHTQLCQVEHQLRMTNTEMASSTYNHYHLDSPSCVLLIATLIKALELLV